MCVQNKLESAFSLFSYFCSTKKTGSLFSLLSYFCNMKNVYSKQSGAASEFIRLSLFGTFTTKNMCSKQAVFSLLS